MGDEPLGKVGFKTQDDDHGEIERRAVLNNRSAATKTVNIMRNQQNRIFIKAQTMSNKMLMN
jgi:hypothetical protein